MIDFLQNMRVQPTQTSTLGVDDILHQLDSTNDATMLKLDNHTQLLAPQQYKHYTKMVDGAADMFFPRKYPYLPPQRRKSENQTKNTRRASTGRIVRGLSANLQIDQDRLVLINMLINTNFKICDCLSKLVYLYVIISSYIERRRSFDERELLEKLKQEDYENYLRQRNLRVSNALHYI